MDKKSLRPVGRWSSPARTLGETDPFSLMRHQMDRLFDSFSRDWGSRVGDEREWSLPGRAGGAFLSPRVDVAETAKGLEISAELPGIDQKDIQLDLTDGILTLKAEHKEEKEEKDEEKHYHVVERSHGSVMRRFAIPFEPNAQQIQASFEKGVLKVMIPRSQAAEKQVRKIAISGS